MASRREEGALVEEEKEGEVKSRERSNGCRRLVSASEV